MVFGGHALRVVSFLEMDILILQSSKEAFQSIIRKE